MPDGYHLIESNPIPRPVRQPRDNGLALFLAVFIALSIALPAILR